VTRELQAVLTDLYRQSGRRYPALEAARATLPEPALKDFTRLLRDLDADANQKARQAATPFPSMPDVLPEGEAGLARVCHFEIDEKAAKMTSLPSSG